MGLSVDLSSEPLSESSYACVPDLFVCTGWFGFLILDFLYFFFSWMEHFLIPQIWVVMAYYCLRHSQARKWDLRSGHVGQVVLLFLLG